LAKTSMQLGCRVHIAVRCITTAS